MLRQVRLTYANCFGADRDTDWLATDELLVGEAAPPNVKVVFADKGIPADDGQRANIALWQLAFDWFLTLGSDPTVVMGVSAGDLAGVEVGQWILLPAARGALAMAALLDELHPDHVRTAVPTAGSETFRLNEIAQSDGAHAAVRARLGIEALGQRIEVDDPRDSQLVKKYAHRDTWRRRERLSRRARLATAELVTRSNRALRWNAQPTLLVQEYNPTQAFASEYASRADRPRMVRIGASRSALRISLARGDVIRQLPPLEVLREPSMRARLEAWTDAHAAQLRERFIVGKIPLWDAVRPHVLDLVEMYAAYANAAVPEVEALLKRERVARVLVPFDTPPISRLLVRVAQRAGIPTFVLPNGVIPDEFQAESLTADVGLAWSDAVAQTTFRRRTSGTVVITGNPKADRPHRKVRTGVPPRRVLVGSFTFSAGDLNCGRSDPERYLEQVMAGVALGAPEVTLTLKLHPSDTQDYATLLGRSAVTDVRVITTGDVCALFADADVYVTTYSTSLLEAAAHGLPVIYYAVNDQRFLPPFGEDSFLEEWTATTPTELAGLLRRLSDNRPDPIELAAWAEQYLGPLDGGSVKRVASALASAVDRSQLVGLRSLDNV